MSLRKKLLKLAGKDNYEIDARVRNGYVFSLCVKYGYMMLRGKFFALGYSGIDSSIFIGKNVKVKEKRLMKTGSKTKIHDQVYIDALSTDGVVIGDNVVIGRNSHIECTGSIENVGKGVTIGNRSTFGNDCFFGAAGGITIGDDVIAGQYIRFHSENHNFADRDKLIREQGVTHKGIVIGNNCWIGSGVVFLDGAKIGDGCVVAANAVVTGCFSDNSVIGGVPAKLIKER